jgi:translation initiation factor 3 subunit A
MNSPDAILAKANEFVKSGDEENALLIIDDFIHNTKKKNWSHSYESLILLLVELTVKTNKIRLLKDGLIFYRTISQTTNIESFQEILSRTKELVEEKFVKAQKSYQGIVKYINIETRHSGSRLRRQPGAPFPPIL